MVWTLLTVQTTDGSRLTITRAASTNQKVTPHEKPEESPPYLPHNLKHSNRAIDWCFPTKTFQITNDDES